MLRAVRFWVVLGLMLAVSIPGILLITGGVQAQAQTGAPASQAVALAPEQDGSRPDASTQPFQIFIPSMGYDLVGDYGGQYGGQYGGGYYGASSDGGAVQLGTVAQAVQSFWWVALLALVVGTTLYDGWSRRAYRTTALTPEA